MIKGISFGSIHSFNDLNLLLSALEITPAEPKTIYIDVPGRNGSVDLTEANGEIVYYDRECTFTFTVMPSDDLTWEERKTEVSNMLNGKVFNITLDDDDGYYYRGRCTVESYKKDRNIKQIIVSAKVAPYKLKQNETVQRFALSGTAKVVKLKNGRMPVSPFIECSNDNTVVTFGTNTFNLNAGTYKLLDIRFVEGINNVTISGSGEIVFRYREGEL